MQVTFSADSLVVSLKSTKQLLLRAKDLAATVFPDDCTWHLSGDDPDTWLVMSLAKTKNGRWGPSLVAKGGTTEVYMHPDDVKAAREKRMELERERDRERRERAAASQRELEAKAKIEAAKAKEEQLRQRAVQKAEREKREQEAKERKLSNAFTKEKVVGGFKAQVKKMAKTFSMIAAFQMARYAYQGELGAILSGWADVLWPW